MKMYNRFYECTAICLGSLIFYEDLLENETEEKFCPVGTISYRVPPNIWRVREVKYRIILHIFLSGQIINGIVEETCIFWHVLNTSYIISETMPSREV